MTGVIPSPEFNEQLKRVVRETIRRERNKRQTRNRWHKKGGGGSGGSFGEAVITEADCPNYRVKINADASTTWTSGGVALADQDDAGDVWVYDPCPDANGHMAPWTETELTGKVVQFWRVQNIVSGVEEYHITHICIRVSCDEVA